MISGASLPPGRIALGFAQRYQGAEGTIVGSASRCAPIESAFVNGMLAHADETDDAHSPSHSHPGCGVIPAALAAGEHFYIIGAEFLRTVVLGYDVGTRLTMSRGGLAWQVETHRSTHSIANTFGAAAALR
jgi:2-methylcitrate dehydratase PrpD